MTEQIAEKDNEVASTAPEGISKITVAGFKSLVDEQSIEIRPLTILAGANSSGKSSIMQPLLLLKQTLEAQYDPGPLLLYGPNVKFTSTEQFFSKIRKPAEAEFRLAVEVEEGASGVTLFFHKEHTTQLSLRMMQSNEENSNFTLQEKMTSEEIIRIVPDVDVLNEALLLANNKPTWVIVRDRCFLKLALKLTNNSVATVLPIGDEHLEHNALSLIHLPGLRSNPERIYPITATGDRFPGTFDNYTASVIMQWQLDGETEKIGQLNAAMKKLGLAETVVAKPLNDAQVEVLVSRVMHGSNGSNGKRNGRGEDLVSIADVGVGVSQTLPVVVAVLTAKPGQLVYLEQPEIHLHPRAQLAMAEVLAEAAQRGVRLVVETHSDLLLLGMQTLVAEGKLPTDLVKLHWFKRNKSGATEIISADLDEEGAFGDWPEDFDDVTLQAEKNYLDAANIRARTRLAQSRKNGR